MPHQSKDCILTLMDDFGFEEVSNKYDIIECHSPSMTLTKEVISELTKLSKKADVWVITNISNGYGLYSGEHLYNLPESSLSTAIQEGLVGSNLAEFDYCIRVAGKYANYYKLNSSYLEVMSYNLGVLESRMVNIRLLMEP